MGLKNTVTKVENSQEGLNSSFERAGEKIKNLKMNQ